MSAAVQAGEKTASFAEFARKAQNGEKLNVVFIGGSLTWGANASDEQKTSYRAYTGEWMRDYFPKASFRFIDAAIGGTGSDLGLFRIERDVLKYNPDLVFLDFTVNDGVDDDSLVRNETYEALLRHLISRGVPVVQVLLGVQHNYAQKTPLEAAKRRLCHLKIQQAYNTGLADTHTYIRDLVAKGEIDLVKNYPFEGTHPDDPGYYRFFESARDGLLKAIADNVVCRIPEKPVYSLRFMNYTRLNVADIKDLPAGWTIQKTLRIAHWFDGLASRWMDDALVFDAEKTKEAQPLKLEFTGSLLGIFGEGKDNGLNFQVKVDGELIKTGGKTEWKTASPMAANNLFYWRNISFDLKPGKHTVEIIPVIPATGKGQLRIGFIGYAGD